ncbi:MAG: winged helix-turn-helix transcriptional regulator [Proteobacteria bacterium]|nr:winged helix-turn-helix transcriptional regulator [Pseudomonadota bacterium]
MQWESLGFKENPFSTEPITQITLPLYTGHEAEVAVCKKALSEKNIFIVIEGARGVGTTSFANYLRFSAQAKKNYFTPRNEVRVEPDWNLETLLAVIIANIVREIELFQSDKAIKDKRFQNAKALSMRIAEAYRSFGIEAFGFGVNYGKSAGNINQPIVVPSAVLGHHLEDLAALIKALGYRYGILLQLNNLDIGTVHEEKHLKYLFNAIRDYIQTDGISWIFVGDIGLRRFIAQEVDRLDDIVSYEAEIPPITKSKYEMLIKKRIQFYQFNPKASLPVEQAVFSYLYEITKGRLRYIFGLLHRLMDNLHVGDLTDQITLDLAKPMIIKLARDRISRNKISPVDEEMLKLIAKRDRVVVSDLVRETKKSASYVSNILSKLAQFKLITVQQKGRNRYYSPSLDAIIAFS